jgi:hypothetical protein
MTVLRPKKKLPFPNTIKYIFVFKEGLNHGSWFRLKNAVLGLAQQRYAKSHRILANCLGVKDFGDSGIPKTRPVLVGQFWGLDSDRILKLVLREIILSQNVSPHGVYQMHRFN